MFNLKKGVHKYSVGCVVNFLFVAVKPKEVRILSPVYNMTAGDVVELVCQSSGSRPSAKLSWWRGETRMDEIGESVSDDGLVTTSFLTFVPSVDDNGKFITCSATNPQFPQYKMDDGWQMNVKCKQPDPKETIIHKYM